MNMMKDGQGKTSATRFFAIGIAYIYALVWAITYIRKNSFVSFGLDEAMFFGALLGLKALNDYVGKK